MKILYVRLLILGALLLVIGAVNGSMLAKERIKRDGERIYLKLAPVDPRALMQGDYMALRFDIENALQVERAGSVTLRLDAQRVATADPDATGGLRLRYRIHQGRPWIGTNAYFFEEGTANRYTGAKYGEFRLDRGTGEAVLVALTDENLRPL